MKLFVVIRTHGDAWQPSQPLEGQEDWAGHAGLMDAFVAEGFMVLGGPLEGTPETLLIVRAQTQQEAVDKLATDPWVSRGLLRLVRISPWNLRLGSLPGPK